MAELINPMIHRRLRIARSIAWGIVAVLLVAAWVRSYWWFDAWEGGPIHIQFLRGKIAIFKLNQPQGYAKYSFPARTMLSDNFGYIITGSFETVRPGNVSVYRNVSNNGKQLAIVPYWLIASPAIVLAFLSFAPWRYLRSRFSLRTLLIATTLIAAGLGLFTWLTR